MESSIGFFLLSSLRPLPSDGGRERESEVDDINFWRQIRFFPSLPPDALVGATHTSHRGSMLDLPVTFHFRSREKALAVKSGSRFASAFLSDGHFPPPRKEFPPSFPFLRPIGIERGERNLGGGLDLDASEIKEGWLGKRQSFKGLELACQLKRRHGDYLFNLGNA